MTGAKLTRRECLAAAWMAGRDSEEGRVMTVRGPVAAGKLGVMLPHEHLFSNFGEEPAEPPVYDEAALLAAVTPYARRVRQLGCGALADATAAWFGRSPALLRRISEQTGLHILTNTGYYGAASDRYVPRHAFEEDAARLAGRWVREWSGGIGGTGVRPGFIKTGVDAGPLSDIDAKLVRAGAITHRECGLTIAVHTGGNPEAAIQQMAILREEGVSPEAWIWVHAHQVKRDEEAALDKAAGAGAWISLDGLDEASMERHLELAVRLRNAGHLGRLLLSHDGNSFRAGGKRPMRPFTLLFEKFLPELRKAGFTEAEVRQVIRGNPARAFTVRRRLAG
jgi:predicted metal-dependent phosphotriesterase family hydrolase